MLASFQSNSGNKMKPTNCQSKALGTLESFLLDPDLTFASLTGGSGRGKTFITQAIPKVIRRIESFHKSMGANIHYMDIAYCASTNKAAQQLNKACGYIATTLHSLLKLRMAINFKTGKEEFKQGKEKPNLSNKLILIDESSMLNTEILQILKDSVGCNTKVIFIGDPYQLLPIGEASCGAFDMVQVNAHLEEPVRQSSEDSIFKLGEAYLDVIKGAGFPDIVLNEPNVFHMYGDDFQEAISKTFVKNKVPESKVLAWKNETVNGYNNHIREELGLPSHYIVGEKVIANKPITGSLGYSILAQTEEELVIEAVEDKALAPKYEGIPLQTYRIRNEWVRVATDPQLLKSEMQAAYEEKDFNRYLNLKHSFADIRPSYASTVDKSQGSTYQDVFIDLEDIGQCWEPDRVARMLYVAITRAKGNVYLYGDLPRRYGSIKSECK